MRDILNWLFPFPFSLFPPNWNFSLMKLSLQLGVYLLLLVPILKQFLSKKAGKEATMHLDAVIEHPSYYFSEFMRFTELDKSFEYFNERIVWFVDEVKVAWIQWWYSYHIKVTQFINILVKWWMLGGRNVL